MGGPALFSNINEASKNRNDRPPIRRAIFYVISHAFDCRVKQSDDSANEMRSANQQAQAIWLNARQSLINKLTKMLPNKI